MDQTFQSSILTQGNRRPSTCRFSLSGTQAEKFTTLSICSSFALPHFFIEVPVILLNQFEFRAGTRIALISGVKSKTGGGMKYKLEIFRSLPDGQYLWIKTVEGLEEAKSQLRSIAQREPGDYFIFDTSTGSRYGSAVASLS